MKESRRPSLDGMSREGRLAGENWRIPEWALRLVYDLYGLTADEIYNRGGGREDVVDGADGMENEVLIPKHGGYRKLKSFQIAQLVYDVTVRFCARYVDRKSRTRDQMVQAARSGVQNIAEGSQASGTSKKMELKLTSVARASLEELRLDYEDFLRQRRLPQWPADDPRRRRLVARRCAAADEVARWVREIHNEEDGPDGRNGPQTRSASMKSISSIASIPGCRAAYPELAANAALVLIGVASALLDRQLKHLEQRFLDEGGFTERLYRARREARDLSGRSHRSQGEKERPR
jgi:four helix bundle suffix protein